MAYSSEIIRILKNKTANAVEINCSGKQLVIPPNSETDLAIHFRLNELAANADILTLLNQGTTYYQMNDGSVDYNQADGIDLAKAYIVDEAIRQKSTNVTGGSDLIITFNRSGVQGNSYLQNNNNLLTAESYITAPIPKKFKVVGWSMSGNTMLWNSGLKIQFIKKGSPDTVLYEYVLTNGQLEYYIWNNAGIISEQVAGTRLKCYINGSSFSNPNMYVFLKFTE